MPRGGILNNWPASVGSYGAFRQAGRQAGGQTCWRWS